jgi:hypothetical protein
MQQLRKKLVLISAALVLVGCTGILGDFTVNEDVADDGGGDASTYDGRADAPKDGSITDAGPSNADTGETAPPCGTLGLTCCNGRCADSSLNCIDNICHSAATGDLGKLCADGRDCTSGVCLTVAGDAGADGGTAVCTNACSPDAGTLDSNDAGLGTKCLAGWTCGKDGGSSTPVCTCVRGAEVCNGKDDDCDGTVDNGTAGGACKTGKDGVCAAGTSTCTAGVPGCIQNVQPGTEVCDGLDNNCNGQVDEGNPGGGGSCTAAAKGAWAVGMYTCVGGQIQCVSQNSPSSSYHYSPASNGSWDWSCDGNVTESEPSGGSFWGIAYAGCSSSTTYQNICSGLVNSAPVCNGQGIYYHCQPTNSQNNRCGEQYYYFTCSAGANYCSFPGSLSGPYSNGCY